MCAFQVTLFGKAAIRIDGAPLNNLPAKAQELLFFLLVHGRPPQAREALACVLWNEASAPQAKKYLRQCLWQLQQIFDTLGQTRAPLLYSDREWINFHPEAALEVDAIRFEQAFATVRDIDGVALSAAQALVVQDAAALYQGELLSGWYYDWCLVERARYESMFFAMLDKLMDYCLAHRQFDQGIGYGMRLLHLEYTRESTHRRMMQLYEAAADRTSALRQFEICAAALSKEFGVLPTTRTIALFEQIRAGRANADGVVRAPAQPAGMEPELLKKLLSELSMLHSSISQLQYDIEQIRSALRA